MGCTYLAPVVMALYWKRATRAGALAAMLGGFLGVTLFWTLGWMGYGKTGKTGPSATDFAPFYLLELDPMIYGLLISFALGIVVSLLTRPMPPELVNPYFIEGEPAPPESVAGQWKRMTGRS